MDKIAALEKRLKELYAQELTDVQFPPVQRAAIKAARDMLIEEIEDRLARLRAGQPDVYS